LSYLGELGALGNVLKNSGTSLRLDTPLLDDNAGATNVLGNTTIGLEADEASHLTDDLVIGELDESDVVLLAEGSDELLVSRLIAVSRENSNVSSALIKSLDRLVETASKTLVVERVLDDLLKSLKGGKDDLGCLLNDNSSLTVKEVVIIDLDN